MELTGIIVAFIGASATVTVAVVAAWADLRNRTNGSGPLAKKIDSLAARLDIRMDMVERQIGVLDYRVGALETRPQAMARTGRIITEVQAVKDAVSHD